jgi:hypothetical protein
MLNSPNSIPCPWCGITFSTKNVEAAVQLRPIDDPYVYAVSWACPACNRLVIDLVRTDSLDRPQGPEVFETERRRMWPHRSGRRPPPTEVPEPLASDYREACDVLAASPKAAAALGRRCLQMILRAKGGVTRGNLADEVQEVLDSNRLPPDILAAIDAVRHFGNLAGHPILSQHSGEIVDVETGEAEWTLDILEALFDIYYVQPALLAERQAKLNAKLAEAGKPPMKTRPQQG